MKKILVGLLSLVVCLSAFANVEPTVNIISAEMRSGTSVMDVVYRVDDPNDATVKVRALAFIDGVRSFANVIRPETWVDGTETNLGDAITTGVEHTLSWDVAADWNTDLGNLKFEVLCREPDGLLLAIDWLTIPAAVGEPELTISENSPADTDVLDAFFWQYGDFDPDISVTTNGYLMGTATSDEYAGITLIEGNTVGTYGLPYICRAMDLDPASAAEVRYVFDAIGGQLNLGTWYVKAQSYGGVDVIRQWGRQYSSMVIPRGYEDVVSVDGGDSHSMALTGDGVVIAWGSNSSGQSTVPSTMTNALAICASGNGSTALTSDGKVVAWGSDSQGQGSVPSELTNVTAIAMANYHRLALADDGTVVAWGNSINGRCDVPSDLTNAVAIAAGNDHSLALTSDGWIVAWGSDNYGQCDVPSDLTNAVAIAAGYRHSLALTSDGKVVAWGGDSLGQSTVPASLTNVISIAAGNFHNIALTSAGRVVTWGANDQGQSTVPSDLINATTVSAANSHNLAIITAP